MDIKFKGGGQDGYKSINNSRIEQQMQSFSGIELGRYESKKRRETEQQKKKINFQEELNKYRKRTEAKLPYTIQQIEDVMFVNEKQIVSLEYITYTNKSDGRYHRLRKITKDSKVQSENQNNLGTQDYIADQSATNPHNAFAEQPIDFEEIEKDYLQEHKRNPKKGAALLTGDSKKLFGQINKKVVQNIKQEEKDKNKKIFMEPEKRKNEYTGEMEDDNDAVVEAILSLWNCNSRGQLIKKKQISFVYDFKFSPSKDDRLRLKLSSDRKVVSLTVTGSEDKKESSFGKLSLYAWSASNLKSINISKSLSENINKVYHDQLNKMADKENVKQLLDIRVVGKSKYIMMNYNICSKDGKIYKCWTFFNIQTGKKVFDINNNFIAKYEDLKYKASKQDDEEEELVKKDYRFIGLQPKEKRKALRDDQKDQKQPNEDSEYGSEIDADEEEEDDDNKQGFESDQEVDKQYSDDEGSDDQYEGGQENEENLDLVFFFVADVRETMENKAHKHKIDIKWVCTKIKINISEIIRDSQDKNQSYLEYITEKIKEEKFDKYESIVDKDYQLIPKSWFKGKKEEKWEHQIEVSCNRKFTQFCFIHRIKKQYLCFDWNDQEPIGEQFLPDTAMTSFARNQSTQDFLWLISRTPGDGSQATCFYEKDIKKTIRFKDDHKYASQDVIHQRVPNSKVEKDPQQRVLQQSITITKGDQELWMLTQVKNHQQNDDNNKFYEIVERKSISQRHSAKFPVFVYNIGQQKLIIQNTLKDGKQYVYELDNNEQFVDHIEFRDFQDIGFYPNNLRIEACSRFAFLSYNRKKKEFIINFLLVDPYQGNCQISLFQSTKRFNNQDFRSKEKDIMVTNIMYCTKKKDKDQDYETKLITQYPNHLKTNILTNLDNDENEEDHDSDSDEDIYDSEQDNEEVGDDDESKNQKISLNKMIQDHYGHIYYITINDGQCIIKEINPKQDTIHIQIYEIKSEVCLGFNVGHRVENQDSFYFMDDNKVINKLQRIKERKQLEEVADFSIKDKELTNFTEMGQYQQTILADQFVIQESKIFYLQQETPFETGILDMEDLKTLKQPENQLYLLENENQESLLDDNFESEEREFASGPFLYQGSQDFVIVYNNKNTNNFYQVIYSLPDSTQTTLISDFDRKTDFSTFLDDGQVLLKIGFRFLIFNEIGQFIDEVDFQDIVQENKKLQTNNKLASAMQQKTQSLEGMIKKKVTINDSAEIQKATIEDDDEENGGIYQDTVDEVQDYNRMRLNKMSVDNNVYLFEDRKQNNFKTYKLQKQADGQYTFVCQKIIDIRQKQFQFLLKQIETYGQKFEDISNLTKADIKRFWYILNDTGYVTRTVVDNGTVLFNLIIKEKNVQRGEEIKLTLYCARFLTNSNEPQTFKQEITFEKNALIHQSSKFDEEEEMIKRKRDIEKQSQNNFPEVFRDQTKTNEYEQELIKIQQSRENILTSQIAGDMMIVKCGKYIKYGKIKESKWEKGSKTQIIFEIARIHLDEEVIIEKIWTTQVKNTIQVIAKDISKEILIVITWDLNDNKEYSMLQYVSEKGKKPENYIVKGVTEKLNYFISEFQIYDLEFNIPMQIQSNFAMKEGIKHKFVNQRKIWKDSTKSLNIDRSNIMAFPLSRMDLMFWQNITDLGNRVSDMKNNVQIQRFNVVYNGISLFHHFADQTEIIQMIHDTYMTLKDDEMLTKEQENVPLNALFPDKYGRTALDLALEASRPQLFEYLINMLEGFDNFSLSKRMLSVLPQMINMGSDTMKNFFATGVFKPPLMQNSIEISNWPDDKDEFIFPCYTSLINPDVVHAALGVSNDEENLQIKETQLIDPSKLCEDILIADSHTTTTQRCQVEALDFDWLFKGDNAQIFLQLLCESENGALLHQKSIKIFIELAWEKYQPKIIYKVFLPYLCYLFSFIFLASKVAGDYLMTLINKENEQKELHQNQPDFVYPRNYENKFDIMVCVVLSLFCFYMLYITTRQEFRSMSTNPQSYFRDPWNYIDLSIFVLANLFLVTLNNNVLQGNTSGRPEGFDGVYSIRTYGAICCWFMWVKVFYWMRIFRNFAYFITIITATIVDSGSFMVMLSIIIFAFANMFFIIQNNTLRDPSYHYVDSYVGISIVDSIIAMYLMSLGEFDFSGYGQGPNKYVAWFFFILGTYLSLIVFMNVLIAIMGDSYGRVSETKEQSALVEQVSIIQDLQWLLDLKEVFKGQRYIIRVFKDEATEKDSQDVGQLIQELNQYLSKKGDSQFTAIIKRINGMEKSNRLQLKSQQAKILSIKKMVTEQKEKAEALEQKMKKEKKEGQEIEEDDE